MFWRCWASLSLSLLFTSALLAGPAYTDPEKADADFPYQGEYVGTVKGDSGDVQVGIQVIAKGKGKFEAVGYHGGLPGAGWDGGEKKHGKGELKDGVLVISSEGHEARIKDGTCKIVLGDGTEIGSLKKTERKSPTLGAEPPKGAIVLFDGKNADAPFGQKTA